MARRGRKRQLDAESLYWQLLLSGTGTVEACKAAGIGRKTGHQSSIAGHQGTVEQGHSHLGKLSPSPPSGRSVVTEGRVPHDSLAERAAYPASPRWHVSHETIYQALYHGGKGGLSRQLTAETAPCPGVHQARHAPDAPGRRHGPSDRALDRAAGPQPRHQPGPALRGVPLPHPRPRSKLHQLLRCRLRVHRHHDPARRRPGAAD
jgi:hypothetical protein